MSGCGFADGEAFAGFGTWENEAAFGIDGGDFHSGSVPLGGWIVKVGRIAVA